MSTREALRLADTEVETGIPAPRPGSIHRTALVNRLRVTRSYPIVTLTAPAGYGKTTVLAQWAERDGRPFVWLSPDEPTPLPETPAVIVLDDAHRVSSARSLKAVAALAERVPAGSTLVLAGRQPPRLPLATLRAEGRLYEVGPDLLALSRREARLLVEATCAELPTEQLDDLLLRAEGWAAGLYLCALAYRDGGPDAELGGDDRYLADYLRLEYLAGLDPDCLSFLRGASMLDRMCGELCDAVLERQDSAQQLEALAERHMFVVPLDRRGEWYRYHGFFRDLLRRELRQHEPRRVAALNRRAAVWCEKHGAVDAAVEYAIEAGDLDRAARLLASRSLPAYDGRRFATVERWLSAFDDDRSLDRYPRVALLGAWVHALRGRPHAAERWLATAERAGADAESPLITVLRAALCRDGLEQMASDAGTAVAEISADSDWHATALLLDGAACALLGQDERADDLLADAADEAESLAATGVRVTALSERAIIAAARSDHGRAETLAREARDLAAGGADAAGALALAVCARALLRRGRWDEARVDLAAAEQLAPRLTRALPWLAVQTLLEVTRAHLTLRNAEGASAALTEAKRILRRRSRLGDLASQADALERDVAEIATDRSRKESGLTAAELRLLPLLSTHLTFREIGTRLLVSRNTVKTQAISVYRKLGVSSRSEAIAAASRLGLVTISP